ncbi:MAG TPA: cyclodeaminase/cyclohydrolase family protein, partial [Anaerolineae bacterium]|nr:cyclodeaminase/cyclohydrolase family protein [Anaerolineae bacterium]
MHEWQAWLDEVSGQTLPGGVSVAAVAAAMGAALAAKAIRVTLARAELSPGDRQTFEAAATATREAQVALLRLSKDDEAAYRRVLAAGKEPAGSRKRRDAWEAAL